MSLDTVKLIFTQRYGVSADEMNADTLIADVCTDSLEVLELLMYIEEEFSINVPDDVAQELKTLGDISGFIDKTIPETTLNEIAQKLQNN